MKRETEFRATLHDKKLKGGSSKDITTDDLDKFKGEYPIQDV